MAICVHYLPLSKGKREVPSESQVATIWNQLSQLHIPVDGQVGVLSFLIFTFQSDGTQSLKDISCLYNWQKSFQPLKYVYIILICIKGTKKVLGS